MMSRQAYIRNDVPITEIRKVKRDLEKFVVLYEKVTFLEEIYSSFPIFVLSPLIIFSSVCFNSSKML